MKGFILTNNPMVAEKMDGGLPVRYEDAGFLEILIAARDCVQRGHRLLTHPLAGNLRPKQSPYKSVLLSGRSGAADTDSVILIEDCIHFCEKHPDTRTDLPENVLEDFQMVDYNLIASAVGGADNNHFRLS